MILVAQMLGGGALEGEYLLEMGGEEGPIGLLSRLYPG
jgi:hypothetical protein